MVGVCLGPLKLYIFFCKVFLADKADNIFFQSIDFEKGSNGKFSKPLWLRIIHNDVTLHQRRMLNGPGLILFVLHISIFKIGLIGGVKYVRMKL